MLDSTFLKDRLVVITGGGTGLGKSMAEACAARGAHIAIAGRRKDVLESAAHDISKHGTTVTPITCDVRIPEQVQNMTDMLIGKYGRIDALINNAAGNFICPAENLSVNGWNSVVNIVLNGTFYCSSSVGKTMIKNGGGTIINIVATYAWASEPGVVHSASAKAGVLAMTRTLAAEWAKYHIRVNAIAPGAIRTEGTDKNLWGDENQRERMNRRIPMRRFGQPDDVSNSLLFLLSDYSNYITGEVITVDGGGWVGKGTYEMVDVTKD
ncbi:2,4-dienoyl-CoA reductase [bacterium]|nr:2,4-dienoyl-CoA reductase [bacterium]